jgi:hypothetical protein
MKELIKCYCGHTTTCDCGPKQECLITKIMQMDAELAYKSLPKQETLEEAETVEEYFLANIKNMLQFNNDALAIRFMEKYYHAKKEQERSYSEEDLKTAFLDGWQLRDGDLPFSKAMKKWFEQFKKK